MTSLQAVTVCTSARLHMGFMDLSCTNTPRFGSLGLSLNAPITQVTLTRNAPSTAQHSDAQKLLSKFCQHWQISTPVFVSVSDAMPRHAGLGSGTQLALAVGEGLNRLLNLQKSLAEIALAAGRGKRSGIGIGAFATGGVLLDAGGGSDKNVPAIIARLDFPQEWRVLLVFDHAHVGIHGASEIQAFKTLPPATEDLTALVTQTMTNAIESCDLNAFGAGMARLQAYNGDYFAPAQGGRYASRAVATVLDWFGQHGVACVGQSSWGPTGFAILSDEQHAQALMQAAQQHFAAQPQLTFAVYCGNNQSAQITEHI